MTALTKDDGEEPNTIGANRRLEEGKFCGAA